MKQEPKLDQPQPRSIPEIFARLREFAVSEGAIHEISAMIFRDYVVSMDIEEKKIIYESDDRWSQSKLIRSELFLLLGLLVQEKSGKHLTSSIELSDFIPAVDNLLSELHERIAKDCALSIDPESNKLVEPPNSLGLRAREAIYYGPEDFYPEQMKKFARERYRHDTDWLLANTGISIRSMIEIGIFIENWINSQIAAIGILQKSGEQLSNAALTESLSVPKSKLKKSFGEKADAFLKNFQISATNSNQGFTDPFSINAATISPIFDLGDTVYVPNINRLFQALYENPFYWMMADKAYANTAAENRGNFTERVTCTALINVFGKENVFERVSIIKNGREVIGEIDVLVVYGEFALIAQAKSKRVTLKARSGDTDALKTDFEGAIETPYRQALSCIQLIKDGSICRMASGEEIKLDPNSRFFPIVVLSDPFPAATFLSHSMLKTGSDLAPVVWDIGVLDCVTRILTTPIDLLFFLKCRADTFDTVIADAEHVLLGYHLRAKLILPADADFMHLHQEFADSVDNFMSLAGYGVAAERPTYVLDDLNIPIVSELLKALKLAPPELAAVVIDIYSYSEESLHTLSQKIKEVRDDVLATGKLIKALSIKTVSGGITYAVTSAFNAQSRKAAEVIGAKHKYDTKSSRWYVIIDRIDTRNAIDGFLPLVWPWEENADGARISEVAEKVFGSKEIPFKVSDKDSE